MSSNKEDNKKKVEDFSDLVNEKIPVYEALAKQGNFGEALEQLLALEKKTRQGGDSPSSGKVLVSIAKVCHDRKELKALNEQIVQLSKRRGLLKEAFKKMVIQCSEFLDGLPYDEKMELMDTLIQVTEGKMFVEKQRARLTLKLALIREKEGKIAEAAKILQEVQVETFGDMKKKEKTEYILEQMRLCLAKRDYIRTQIISKKINPKVLAEPEMQELKVKFNSQMIEYYLNDRKHLEIAKCYHQIYNTPIIQKEEEKLLEALKYIVLYVVLAEHNNEQSDFSHRLSLDVNLTKVPVYKDLLTKFLTNEVMNLNQLKSTYQPVLELLAPFKNGEENQRLWKDFSLRVIEHNLRVVSLYYTRITTSRLSQLLSLSTDETEKYLCDLVVKGSIYARIDRPKGTISFKKNQSPNDVLNKWSSDIDSLLRIVENTCHLIQRENMVHGASTK
eukprot:TRINITY_DN12080_c0_g1_i1.p1 TRINITY_DN12080_c0_g1~~TRINITY_DN12080_c0_g1_i1.p1  ORF type:complete len:446 (-),score=123.86 TRINITY_DN12080_c0_g1_i1:9-1346(-)